MEKGWIAVKPRTHVACQVAGTDGVSVKARSSQKKTHLGQSREDMCALYLQLSAIRTYVIRHLRAITFRKCIQL